MALADSFIFHKGNNTRMMINCVIIAVVEIHRQRRMHIFKLEKLSWELLGKWTLFLVDTVWNVNTGFYFPPSTNLPNSEDICNVSYLIAQLRL